MYSAPRMDAERGRREGRRLAVDCWVCGNTVQVPAALCAFIAERLGAVADSSTESGLPT